MKSIIQELLKEAGKIVLKHYNNPQVGLKIDNSLVTNADIECSNFLTKELISHFSIPVISEEMEEVENIRKTKKYFLIDPLDGTKEFINKQDEFCIIVALIEDNKPVMGAIYAPALDIFAYVDEAALVISGIELKKQNLNTLRGVTSFYHNNPVVDKIYERIGAKTEKVGSAIKFIKLAAGHSNIYLRLEGSKEWDTAAGQMLVEKAGFKMIDLKTMKQMQYGKNTIKNNPFLVIHKNLAINELAVIEYL